MKHHNLVSSGGEEKTRGAKREAVIWCLTACLRMNVLVFYVPGTCIHTHTNPHGIYIKHMPAASHPFSYLDAFDTLEIVYEIFKYRNKMRNNPIQLPAVDLCLAALYCHQPTIARCGACNTSSRCISLDILPDVAGKRRRGSRRGRKIEARQIRLYTYNAILKEKFHLNEYGSRAWKLSLVTRYPATIDFKAARRGGDEGAE